MKHPILTASLLTALATAAWFTAQPPAAAAATTNPAGPLVARGEHMVRGVALCADCHSPRLPTGALDPARWLQGAPIGFKPLIEMPWSPVAPPLAGLPNRTDADVITLLTTGKRPDGTAPLPPMPAFHLTTDEARAVVAYLRSFPAAK